MLISKKEALEMNFIPKVKDRMKRKWAGIGWLQQVNSCGERNRFYRPEWSPTFLASGTSFVEDNFFMDQVAWGDGLGMIQGHYIYCAYFLGGSDGKESTCNAGDLGLITGLGRFPGEGNRYTPHQSCLEKSMDRGDWRATVHSAQRDGND